MSEQNVNSRPPKKESFWNLISRKEICIPNYQREYAQGRNNTRAELIRKGFVSSLYDALCNSVPLELDFIFGGGDSAEKFIPVDGQQRLTILFLLHWYVFLRAGGKEEQLHLLGSKFLYNTRTTSETFCSELCNEEDWNFDFRFDSEGKSRISEEIENKYWFTGAMASDPTVQSMLCVIDCIHEKFRDINDFNSLSDKLTDTSLISFFPFELGKDFGGEEEIRDLYIKMNSRGIPLTDFEVFKADLQKKDTDNGHLDLLSSLLGDADSELARARLIGKFNCKYTNFFFKVIDGSEIYDTTDESSPVQMFDTAMMNFINEIFRMNFFCAVSKLGVGQKEYRSGNEPIRKMSGKEFSVFVRSAGRFYCEKYGIDEETYLKKISDCDNEVKNKEEEKRRIQQQIEGKEAEIRTQQTAESPDRIAIRSIRREINNLQRKEDSLENEIEKLCDQKASYAKDKDNAKNGIRSSFEESFRNIVTLFDYFPESDNFHFDLSSDKLCRYFLSDMVKKLGVDSQESKVLPFTDSFVRMALYEFVLTFKDVPNDEKKKNAIEVWSRFIWKIITNTEFKNFDEVVETLIGAKKIIASCEGCTPEAVTKAIAGFGSDVKNRGGKGNDWSYSAVYQLEEERIKAELIIKDSEDKWKKVLREAEDYFSRCGQIWFLLDLSRSGEGYDYDRFSRAFEVAKSIFDSSYCVTKVDSNLFERALLAVTSGDFKAKDHLISPKINKIEGRKFAGSNFLQHLFHKTGTAGKDKEQERYKIILSLLCKMLESCDSQNASEWLSKFVETERTGIDWKDVFIEYDLLSEERRKISHLDFKDGLVPDAWKYEGFSYTAVYATEQRRKVSGELHSILLASLLKKEGIKVVYHASYDDDYFVEGFPNRYLTVKDIDIGYMKGSYYSQDNAGNVEYRGSLEDTLDWVRQGRS